MFFCCNPAKYYKSHSRKESSEKHKVTNQKIFITFNQINASNEVNSINDYGYSVANQTSDKVNTLNEDTNNILVKDQPFSQISEPTDNANKTITQENLLKKSIYSHCPNCQEQLTLGFFCNVCKNYYFGNCQICNQERTGEFWCQRCESLAYQKNFETWTSGNKNIDTLIQKTQMNAMGNWQVWEWIPYTQFKDIGRLGKGCFGTVYLATWLDGPRDDLNRDIQRVERRPNEKVALKVLHNSQKINADFLKELESNYACRLPSVGWILGVTQDPNTNEYIMVMRYYEEGDFRQFFKRNTSLITWKEKLSMLKAVSGALKSIHKAGLLHRDLHPGNIYQRYNSRYKIYVSYLGDLGLCTPANEPPASKLYGVMPYVAPEVLQNKPYTSESEMYSFGIIMSELASGKPPFASEAHKSDLVLKICYEEYRPEFPHETPKCYVELMKQCWDKNPSKRPTAEMVYNKITEWCDSYESKEEIFELFKASDKARANQVFQEIFIHPEASYNSRLLSEFIIN